MSTKTLEMEVALSDLAEKLFGRRREEGVCVTCGKNVNVETDFRDALSKKEYGISRMCQTCQDRVFEG